MFTVGLFHVVGNEKFTTEIPTLPGFLENFFQSQIIMNNASFYKLSTF